MLIELIIVSSTLCFGVHKKRQEIMTPDNKIAAQKPKEESQTISTIDNKANQGLMLSAVGLSLAILGRLTYYPLRLLSIPFLICETKPIFKDAYQALATKGNININTLSSIVIFVCLVKGYLITAGFNGALYHWNRKLLAKVKNDSSKNLIDVFNQQPSSVWVIVNGIEMNTPINALKMGDIVVVNSGETISVDGVIIDGIALVDQHILTGEAQPIEKEIGEPVFALTVVLSGHILVRVEKAGSETTAAQIGQVLNHTIDFKADKVLWMENMANKMVMPTLIAGALSFPLLGASGAASLINSPPKYRLSIVAPICILHFFNVLSEKGILVKDGRTFEMLNQVNTIVFDKTGTLTDEQPHVGKVYTYHQYDENQILKYAAAAEYKHSHPIAKAILQEVNARTLEIPPIDEAEYKLGYGIKVVIDHKLIRVGSVRFMEMEGIDIASNVANTQLLCYQEGYSLILVAVDNEIVGTIELHATLRPEAKETVGWLHQQGITMYIISGDHEMPTKKLAEELAIKHYFAETLPEAKANIIKQLQQEGKIICYIGDGINDAIALKKAQVSISLSGASSVATDTAQIILMNKKLSQLKPLFEIAKDYHVNIRSTFMVTTIPSVISLGGTLFFKFGVAHSLILGQFGLMAGLVTVMLPQRKNPIKRFPIE